MSPARTAPARNGTAPAKPHRATSHTNGLERERVTDIQRARLLTAMAEVCAERSIANVTVAHVVERAGVSRRTFYEIFGNIEDCFLQALDEAAARARRCVLSVYAAGEKWPERMRSSLLALLSFLDEDPLMSRLLIVESVAAGPEALRRRERLLAQAVAAVDEGRNQARMQPPLLTAEGVVGGVLGVLHSRLSQSGHGSLLDLAGPLMSMIVLPYLGTAAAKRELSRPLPRTAPTPRVATNPLGQLHMRLTYRTIRVLMALAANPGSSNRRVAEVSEISDQGQMSKLLTRLQQLGLIENTSIGGPARGEPNAWTLTSKGWQVHGAVAQQTPG